MNTDTPEWGRYTRNGRRLFAHILDRPMGPILFKGMKDKIRKARMVYDGAEIKVGNHWTQAHVKEDAVLDIPGTTLPDEEDTVIELELA